MLTLNSLIKYLLEGLAVTIAGYLIAGKRITFLEVAIIGFTSAITFMILDLFTTGIGYSARQGLGFGLGYQQFNMMGGYQQPAFDNQQPAFDYQQPAFDNQQLAFDNQQPAFDNQQPTFDNQQPAFDIRPHVGSDPDLSNFEAKETEYQRNFVYNKKTDPNRNINNSSDFPYRFDNSNKIQCPQSVVASSEINPLYAQNRTKSRWMNWDLNGGDSPRDPLSRTSGYYDKKKGGLWGESPHLNTNHFEYKIAPGYYSKYIVRPGYHSEINGSNDQQINQLSPLIWSTKNPLDRNYFLMKEPFIPIGNEEQNGGAYENYENPNTTRLSDVLYSGDIIDLTAGDTIMQRGLINSQIIFDQPLPNVRTNLSKLRIIQAAKNHDPRKQTPIKYGDPIYIKHNALINNNNQTRFIKYGEKFQSHQDGPLFRVYKVYSKKDPKNTDYIRYGDEILISRGDQTGDQIYLKVESDKSVSSQSAVSEATTFGLTLVRVYELYDRNLCVCPQEMLYP